eukprot:scaffold21366_cov72-Skeletonema_dohrnii-CCMP3373.AAC.2
MPAAIMVTTLRACLASQYNNWMEHRLASCEVTDVTVTCHYASKYVLIMRKRITKPFLFSHGNRFLRSFSRSDTFLAHSFRSEQSMQERLNAQW